MVRLVAHHGFVGARIPLATCITLKVTLTSQRLLDFFYALRLQVKARQTLLAGERARPPMARGRTLVMGSIASGAIWRGFRGRCRGRVRSGFSRGVMRRARVGTYPPVGGGK